jgi:hypothetical protein
MEIGVEVIPPPQKSFKEGIPPPNLGENGIFSKKGKFFSYFIFLRTLVICTKLQRFVEPPLGGYPLSPPPLSTHTQFWL